jgi:F-type H+-transporting ATPase subunit epsilon
VDPPGSVADGEVEYVTVPTTTGVITIMPHHVPLVSIISAGELIIKTKNEQIPFAVFSGVVDIRPGSIVNIIVDRSEKAHDIDITRAEEAVTRAKKILEDKVHESDIDFARFEALIEKELNRVRVGTKWKK